MGLPLSQLPEILRRERAEARTIPVPLALGGVGLLFSTALPGGFGGGEGFVAGLVLGFAIVGAKLLFADAYRTTDRARHSDPLSTSGEKVAAPSVRAPGSRVQILLRGD